MSRPCVEYDYLSCAVNRTPHTAVWEHVGEDVLYFAVHKSIAAWEQPGKSRGAARLWPSQLKAQLHVLKALHREGACYALVAGSESGGIEAWCVHDAMLQSVSHIDKAHDGAVTALAVQSEGNTFVSGGADSAVHVWRLIDSNDGASLEQVQTIDLGRAYPLDMALFSLPGSPGVQVLVVGSTERYIRFFVSENGAPFSQYLQLDGHEDWVRCLDVTVAGDEVHLASGSQDSNIRLWKIMRDTPTEAPAKDAFDAQADALLDADGIRTKKNKIPLKTTDAWFVALDALLVGHDGWVTALQWHHPSDKKQYAALLSASADNSMIVWAPRERDADGWPLLDDSELQSALWLPLHRLGDVGSLSGGFLGALWRPLDTNSAVSSAVLTYDRHGALQLWLDQSGRWQPSWAVSGHAGPSSGIAWEPEGDYFLSVGSDRTARLHGDSSGWHEIARPQTHGYDLVKVAWLDRLEFASAADEKIVRIFHSSRQFVERALALGAIKTHVRKTNVVAVHVEKGKWLNGSAFCSTIRTAVEGAQGAVAVLVFSDDLEGGISGAPETLPQIERFLQAVYTYAWATAVKKDELLMDIDVHLIPGGPHTASAHKAVAAWAGDRSPRVATAYYLGDTATVLAPLRAERLVEGVADDASPLEPVSAQAPAPAAVAAVGGTFDHLHIGHKLLLTTAALCASKRLVIGVTDTALLAKKKHARYVESIERRMAAVRSFVRAIRAPFGEIALDVVPISDVAGPAGTDAEISLLVLTEETAAGATAIAGVRSDNGVPPLAVYTVGLVQDDSEASKVGSTAIRGWLETRGEPGTEYTVDYQMADALASLPAGASVPALGLSNRAETDAQSAATPHTLPVTAELQGMLLWPEHEKLYGHGYEILSVAGNAQTRLVASSCKATAPEHAVVRLYDGADRWRPLEPPLEGHSLSVTRVAITADAQYVLSASRDRSWRVFTKDGDSYVPLTGERAHARIVWDAAWSVDGDRVFATVSRDKTAKVWQLTPDGERPHALLATLPHSDAATAVAFGPGGELAVGLESGAVEVYAASADRTTWTHRLSLPQHHTAAVNALAFRPRGAWCDELNNVPYMLLSAGGDGCVRLVSWLATVSS
ncbi:Elongator subunit elp2 [Malassezia cuniculi]|uniref:Elongator complex protein 2 n=1 Tax=Malassezia cuniculi TaxID=948313 RepID=A0AAF0J9E1_9BASI|nr:Elongator subunit elp2 [Malassezia cuniculi]